MTTERKLQNNAINHSLWAEAADEVFHDGWTIQEQGEHYGVALADAVARRQMSLEELHQAARDVGEAQLEALNAAGGNIEAFAHTEDYIEAVARAIAHTATFTARKMVRSEGRVVVYRCTHAQRLGLTGINTPSHPRNLPELGNFGRT